MYHAPVEEIGYTLTHIAGLDDFLDGGWVEGL